MFLHVGGRWALLAALFISNALAQVPDKVKACAACHGADGNSAIAGTPSIAGQPRIFLENYLVMTREGVRGSAVMQALLKGVSDREIIALSRHYSELKARATAEPVNRILFERGRGIAARNRCSSCHLPNYVGREQMPRLAGQREEFLAEVMLQYRQNRRPGGDTMMSAALYGIPEAEFQALAHYFSRLP
ncbi:MAG: c-type cytochrome [Betaproteobacteria bacterium]